MTSETPLTPELEARIKAEVDWLEGVMCDPGEPDEVVWPGTLTLTKRLRAFAREIQEPLLYTSDKQTAAWKARALKAEEKLTWWEHAERYDTARLCENAEGNPSLTLFGPGEPGTRPYFAVSIEEEPDEGGAWGAFLRYGGRDGAPNVGEFKTFPELRAALLEAIQADRNARAAYWGAESGAEKP